MSDRRTWRLVTPEAVALDVEAAGLASRVLAAFLDLLVLYVVFWAIGTAASIMIGMLGPDNALIQVTVTIVAFLVLLGWPMSWEIATKGQSLGKMALGIRVVTLEGAPIRFRHALIRGLVGLVELYLFFGTVALLIALGRRRFRRLGDHLAGTVVVRDRSGTANAIAIRFLPLPGWEQFSAALDVSRLTPDHHRLIRSFLVRSRTLDTATRYRLGGQILDELVAINTLTPEMRSELAAYDPALPLTAVAAAYQRRFSPDPVAAPPYLPPERKQRGRRAKAKTSA